MEEQLNREEDFNQQVARLLKNIAQEEKEVAVLASNQFVRLVEAPLRSYLQRFLQGQSNRTIYDVNDLYQETIIHILSQANQFDPQRGQAMSWILTLSTRRCIDLLRRNSNRRRKGQTSLDSLPETSTTGTNAKYADLRLTIDKIIYTHESTGSTPQGLYREIVLQWSSGKPIRQLLEKKKWSKHTIYTAANNLKEQLRQYVQGE